MKFLDLAKVFIRSGSGGAGAISFRREKFIEYGGPDGGDGGRGGSVWAQSADGLNTLIDFRYQQHFFADNGKSGMGKQRSGASGADKILTVPVGTEILDEDKETILADLTEIGQRVLLAKGGNGGFGNLHFKTSVNQAPRRSNPGQEGVERTIWLRLKLIADVGLLGMPNAGKSTFLAATSNARPKIADYPFTTLTPNLGVVGVDQTELVVADVPGLIEGANEGRGLGDLFLGHIERCAVLLHLVDCTSDDPINDYFIKACACALKDFPDCNMIWQEQHMLKFNEVAIGVAISTETGLYTPTLRNIDKKSLSQISLEMKELIEKAKKKQLRNTDFIDCAHAISNLGMFSIENFDAILDNN